MKKYGRLVGLLLLVLLVCRLGYQAFYAYLGEHMYYMYMLSSKQNRGIFIAAFVFSMIPMLYLIWGSKINLKVFVLMIGICAGLFGAVHSGIKLGTEVMPDKIGYLIVVFNTVLMFSLGTYLISGFAAIGSRLEREFIKFKEVRWQEIFLSFGLGMIAFTVIIQILLGIGLLYGVVSWIIFLFLGFMVWYERKNLGKWIEVIEKILDNYKEGFRSLDGKGALSSKIGFIFSVILILISLGYVYIGIQNAFTPYSTAWDANHEYMYIPKILAENAGVYWGNTVANNMPGLWHQFLAFIFSLTGCTNGWLGLSPDNIAISMNNMSAIFVLLFGIAIVFQIFTLREEKLEEDDEKNNLKKGKNSLVSTAKNLNGSEGVNIGWTILLLWLTSGMGAFLVIVDNKTDLGVMALSLLALLAGLIFLQNRKSGDKKEIIKYVIIAGLFFGFAALAKITAFVDFVLFGLLLIGLRFSSLTGLGLGIMVMGLVRKFNILTSSVMLTDENAIRFIIIGGVITFIGLVTHLLVRNSNREKFLKDFRDLVILGVCFLIPFVLFKLPWTIVSQVKLDQFSASGALRSTFLSKNFHGEDLKNKKLLAQNDVENVLYSSVSDSLYSSVSDTAVSSVENLSIEGQDLTDSLILKNKNTSVTFSQCLAKGNIYSEEELNENLKELSGGGGGEDFGRYIGYGWKEFTSNKLLSLPEQGYGIFKAFWPRSKGCDGASETGNVVCEKNLSYGLLKLLWPTSDKCYGFNYDAKVLCNNASVIDEFKIDDLRAIYENGIKNQDSEAGILLKKAIDSYDQAKKEGKLRAFSDNASIFHDEIVALRQYYQSHSIKSQSEAVYIPYRYLVPLNVSFNWSLQNPSSYYTDIGFIRIIVYVLLIVSLPYAIFRKDNLLTAISLTTLIGWGIWWIIGSAILWYGTALISWSIITLALFIDQLFKKHEKGEDNKVFHWILLVVVCVFSLIQIIFNFMRINSQGASSVFVHYKGNVGTKQKLVIDDSGNFNTEYKVKYGYSGKDIFDLQFPQYNPIINALTNRDNDDGVTVAGTYIQYFLGNQWNIKSDGMLNSFRKNASDGDLCKTYRRLKNDNTRYFIIDPNIGTVTMGEGNETLFYRFFGKLNSNQTAVEMDGTVTTLIRLAKAGYLKLLSTNNLGAKYAFMIDDDVMREFLGGNLTDEELIVKRAKMAVLQYFGDNDIFGAVANIFMMRIMNDMQGGIEDIADIYGFEVNSSAIADAAYKMLSENVSLSDRQKILDTLSENEKTILFGYLNIYSGYVKDSDGIWPSIQNLIVGSISGGSQIIALELN